MSFNLVRHDFFSTEFLHFIFVTPSTVDPTQPPTTTITHDFW